MFMNLFKDSPCLTSPVNTTSPVKYNVTYPDIGTPSERQSTLPEGLNIARWEFEHMLELSIVHPSSRPWSSPFHLVPKSSPGDWRPCGDYRSLYKVTQPDHYPVPHLHDFVGTLQRATVFSKIDLIKAYHHIPVEEANNSQDSSHDTLLFI